MHVIPEILMQNSVASGIAFPPATPVRWTNIQIGQVNTVDISQEMDVNPWNLGSCAVGIQVTNHGEGLVNCSSASLDHLLARRPVYTVQDGKITLDPSAMDVNIPYCVELSSGNLWAVKDRSNDVILFELGEFSE